MQAGRELDAVVAERVMGWQRMLTTLYPGVEDIEGTLFISPDGLEFYEYGQGEKAEIPNSLPRYSTNIADAWMVVEKLKHRKVPSDIYPDETETSEGISALLRTEDGRWMVIVDNSPCALDEGYYERSVYPGDVVIGDTAPHAICLAALKAKQAL